MGAMTDLVNKFLELAHADYMYEYASVDKKRGIRTRPYYNGCEVLIVITIGNSDPVFERLGIQSVKLDNGYFELRNLRTGDSTGKIGPNETEKDSYDRFMKGTVKAMASAVEDVFAK